MLMCSDCIISISAIISVINAFDENVFAYCWNIIEEYAVPLDRLIK